MRLRRGLLASVAGAALAGAVLSANVDVSAPPFVGPERLSAVVLLDGQAYFGRLDDRFWSDELVLHEAYYLRDARSAGTELPLALAERGSEVHAPVGTMRIRRDRVLLVERVGPGSAVAAAIQAERAIELLAR